MAQIKIKQYGLGRTGTNLCKKVLEENYDVKVYDDRYGWKHGCHSENNKLPILISVRHPLSWLPACWRFGQTKRGAFGQDFTAYKSFSDFIQNKGKETDKGDLPLLHLWSFAYGYWAFSQRQKIILRFEALLSSPEETCQDIAMVFGLEKTREKFWFPSEVVGPTERKDKRTSVVLHETTEEKYMDFWDDELLQYASCRIDHSVLWACSCFWPNKMDQK